MEKEIKELLNQIIANQVIIFKKIDGIERKMNGKTASTFIDDYLRELMDESDKIKYLL